MLALKLLKEMGGTPSMKLLGETKKFGKFAGQLPLAQAAKKANMPIYQMFKKRYGQGIIMIGPIIRAGISAAKRFKMKRNAKKFEKDLKKNEHVGGFVPQKQIDKFNLKRKGKNPIDRFLKKYTDF